MKRFTFIAVLSIVMVIFNLVMNYDNLNKSIIFILMTGPFLAQILIGLALALRWKKVIEFLPASILIVRFVTCLAILDSIEFKDGKASMQDSVFMIALPLQVCCSTNTRIDLLFTIPFGLISSAIIMDKSLGDFDLLEACITEPELYLRS